jgi:hypothetical protein
MKVSIALPLLLVVFMACGEGEPARLGAPEQTTVAVEPTPTASPGPSPTPPPGLTETGFEGQDGRPLYAECIQPGAPMPPQIPTPLATQFPDPTPTPGDPNTGKVRPTAADLPPFDLATLEPADATAWEVHDSACYGYSVKLPSGWSTRSPFTHRGYQLGEQAEFESPNGSRVAIGVSYTPVDQPDPPLGFQDFEYLLVGPRPIELDGRPGRETSIYSSGSGFRGVRLGRIYSPRENVYVGVVLWLKHPYDESDARAGIAVLSSLTFR